MQMNYPTITAFSPWYTECTTTGYFRHQTYPDGNAYCLTGGVYPGSQCGAGQPWQGFAVKAAWTSAANCSYTDYNTTLYN